MVPKISSIFPRPRGSPAVLWMSWTFRSAQTWAMWSLVKSAPWSLYRAAGSPQTGHAGSGLRQIACRNANAVCNEVGSPRNTVYPETAPAQHAPPGSGQNRDRTASSVSAAGRGWRLVAIGVAQRPAQEQGSGPRRGSMKAAWSSQPACIRRGLLSTPARPGFHSTMK